MARKTGRPSKYTVKLGEEICRRLYESEEGELPESLRKICRDPKMPSRVAVWRWLNDHAEFRNQYARARDLRKEALIERLVDLSAKAVTKATGAPGTGEAGAKVQAVKLEIDTIKWILSKEYARDYGDKVTQEHTGPDGGPIKQESSFKVSPEDEAMIKRIAEKREHVKEG